MQEPSVESVRPFIQLTEAEGGRVFLQTSKIFAVIELTDDDVSAMTDYDDNSRSIVVVGSGRVRYFVQESYDEILARMGYRTVQPDITIASDLEHLEKITHGFQP